MPPAQTSHCPPHQQHQFQCCLRKMFRNFGLQYEEVPRAAILRNDVVSHVCAHRFSYPAYHAISAQYLRRTPGAPACYKFHIIWLDVSFSSFSSDSFVPPQNICRQHAPWDKCMWAESREAYGSYHGELCCWVWLQSESCLSSCGVLERVPSCQMCLPPRCSAGESTGCHLMRVSDCRLGME